MSRFKNFICLVLIFLFRLLPMKKNKVLLFSYYGQQYGCNPKYISQYLQKAYETGTFDIVWAFADPSVQQRKLKGVRTVKTMTPAYFYELCTAKVIITNFRTTNLFVKRKKQYYIQTWHSSCRLKQIEQDAEESLPQSYIKMAKKDASKCDLLVSGSRYSTEIMERAFWYKGEIYPFGTPRNDLFFQQNMGRRTSILRKLSIPGSYKITLYAPTFRSNQDMELFSFDKEKALASLSSRFGGRWLLLVKLHPHMIMQANEIAAGENIIDVTTYDDIQELLMISDVLITDYSSLMFDFAITRRPCFLYVPDLETYVNEERSFYFQIDKLPFLHAVHENQLHDRIRNFNSSNYAEVLEIFLQKIGSYEKGNASKALAKRVYNVCFPKKRRDIDESVPNRLHNRSI
ncbi:CDP-glycerol glycerophosphotransferase family protein [Bacillaceae bacterium Marseille-Q3522]|nr:CDP-glycerol glycerophosphotransferase family protein [Bacillaceae bacterium Marseille-Q3522]